MKRWEEPEALMYNVKLSFERERNFMQAKESFSLLIALKAAKKCRDYRTQIKEKRSIYFFFLLIDLFLIHFLNNSQLKFRTLNLFYHLIKIFCFILDPRMRIELEFRERERG